VLLHNDNFNKREYVVSVLLKVVEGYTVDDAVAVMHEAHLHGLALVTQETQETAERYCESMRNSGLTASIEPAGAGP
jgi:ATP-dependent Clp protease adapter protein ClpS